MSLFKELESLESSPEYLAMSPEERTDVLRGWQSQTTGNPDVDQSRKQVASEAIASRNSFFRAKMPVNPLTGALRETAPPLSQVALSLDWQAIEDPEARKDVLRGWTKSTLDSLEGAALDVRDAERVYAELLVAENAVAEDGDIVEAAKKAPAILNQKLGEVRAVASTPNMIKSRGTIEQGKWKVTGEGQLEIDPAEAYLPEKDYLGYVDSLTDATPEEKLRLKATYQYRRSAAYENIVRTMKEARFERRPMVQPGRTEKFRGEEQGFVYLRGKEIPFEDVSEVVLTPQRSVNYEEKGGEQEALFSADPAVRKEAETRTALQLAQHILPASNQHRLAGMVLADPEGPEAKALVEQHRDYLKSTLWVRPENIKNNTWEKARVLSDGEVIVNGNWARTYPEDFSEVATAIGAPDKADSIEKQVKDSQEAQALYMLAHGGALDKDFAPFVARMKQEGVTDPVEIMKAWDAEYDTLDNINAGLMDAVRQFQGIQTGLLGLIAAYTPDNNYFQDLVADRVMASQMEAEIEDLLAGSNKSPLIRGIATEVPWILGSFGVGAALRSAGRAAVSRALSPAARAEAVNLTNTAVNTAVAAENLAGKTAAQISSAGSFVSNTYFGLQASRSFGGMYESAYAAKFEQAQAAGLDIEAAKRVASVGAIAPALAAGMATGFLMRVMPGGTESAIRSLADTATIGSLRKKFGAKAVSQIFANAEFSRTAYQYVSGLLGKGGLLKALGKTIGPAIAGATKEGIEEATDEAFQAALTTDFDPRMTLRAAMEQAVTAGYLGAVIGGSMTAVSNFMANRSTAAAYAEEKAKNSRLGQQAEELEKNGDTETAATMREAAGASPLQDIVSSITGTKMNPEVVEGVVNTSAMVSDLLDKDAADTLAAEITNQGKDVDVSVDEDPANPGKYRVRIAEVVADEIEEEVPADEAPDLSKLSDADKQEYAARTKTNEGLASEEGTLDAKVKPFFEFKRDQKTKVLSFKEKEGTKNTKGTLLENSSLPAAEKAQLRADAQRLLDIRNQIAENAKWMKEKANPSKKAKKTPVTEDVAGEVEKITDEDLSSQMEEAAASPEGTDEEATGKIREAVGKFYGAVDRALKAALKVTKAISRSYMIGQKYEARQKANKARYERIVKAARDKDWVTFKEEIDNLRKTVRKTDDWVDESIEKLENELRAEFSIPADVEVKDFFDGQKTKDTPLVFQEPVSNSSAAAFTKSSDEKKKNEADKEARERYRDQRRADRKKKPSETRATTRDEEVEQARKQNLSELDEIGGVEGLKNNLPQVLREIASRNALLRPVIEAILGPGDFSVDVEVIDDPKAAPGWFQPAYGDQKAKIVYNIARRSARGVHDTIVHEVAHHVLDSYMERDWPADSPQAEAIREILAVQKAYQQRLMANLASYMRLANIDDAMAAAMEKEGVARDYFMQMAVAYTMSRDHTVRMEELRKAIADKRYSNDGFRDNLTEDESFEMFLDYDLSSTGYYQLRDAISTQLYALGYSIDGTGTLDPSRFFANGVSKEFLSHMVTDPTFQNALDVVSREGAEAPTGFKRLLNSFRQLLTGKPAEGEQSFTLDTLEKLMRVDESPLPPAPTQDATEERNIPEDSISERPEADAGRTTSKAGRRNRARERRKKKKAKLKSQQQSPQAYLNDAWASGSAEWQRKQTDLLNAWDRTPSKGNPDTLKTGFLTGKHSATIANAAEGRNDLGLLVTPIRISELKHAAQYSFIGIDNGVFGKNPFDAEKFRKLIRRAADTKEVKERTLFVVAPDVIGDAEATLKQFSNWAKEIRAAGLPVALAGQDGLENMIDKIPWDLVDVFFIGGSTDWKLGNVPAENKDNFVKLFEEAHLRGIPIHMGRANTAERIAGDAQIMGVSTVDGTAMAYAPDINLKNITEILESLNEEGVDFGGMQFPELGRAPSSREIYDLAMDDSIKNEAQLGAYSPARSEINKIRKAAGMEPIRTEAKTPRMTMAAGTHGIVFPNGFPADRGAEVLGPIMTRAARSFGFNRELPPVQFIQPVVMFPGENGEEAELPGTTAPRFSDTVYTVEMDPSAMVRFINGRQTAADIADLNDGLVPVINQEIDSFFGQEPGPERRYILAGSKARLNQRRDLAMTTARILSAFGASRRNIWKLTGWIKNPVDGKWRWELSDEDASLDLNALENLYEARIRGFNDPVKLSDFLKHDTLYKTYPSASLIVFDYDDLGPNTYGLYTPKNNKITLSTTALDPLSTVLHELQHWVQEREGFVGGVDFDMAVEALPDSEFDEFLQQAIYFIRNEWNGRVKYKDLADESIEVLENSETTKAEAAKIIAAFPEIAYPIYLRVAGEYEARDVAARRRLTAADRRQILPYTSEDLDFADLLVPQEGDQWTSSVTDRLPDSIRTSVSETQLAEITEMYNGLTTEAGVLGIRDVLDAEPEVRMAVRELLQLDFRRMLASGSNDEGRFADVVSSLAQITRQGDPQASLDLSMTTVPSSQVTTSLNAFRGLRSRVAASPAPFTKGILESPKRALAVARELARATAASPGISENDIARLVSADTMPALPGDQAVLADVRKNLREIFPVLPAPRMATLTQTGENTYQDKEQGVEYRYTMPAGAFIESRLIGNRIQVSSAVPEYARKWKVEHELGHWLYRRTEYRPAFQKLWDSLSAKDHADINEAVEGLYSKDVLTEEKEVRALELIRTRASKKPLWRKFVDAVSRLWKKVTGRNVLDAEQLASRMIAVASHNLFILDRMTPEIVNFYNNEENFTETEEAEVRYSAQTRLRQTTVLGEKAFLETNRQWVDAYDSANQGNKESIEDLAGKFLEESPGLIVKASPRQQYGADRLITEGRKENLGHVLSYFENNVGEGRAYTKSEAAAIVGVLLKRAITWRASSTAVDGTRIPGKLDDVSIEPTNDHFGSNFNGAIAAAAITAIRGGAAPRRAYGQAVEDELKTEDGLGKTTRNRGWVHYEKGGDWKVLQNDTEGCSGRWCIGRGMASHYLEKGSFEIFFDDSGRAKVAVHHFDGEVNEISGSLEGQHLDGQFESELAISKVKELGLTGADPIIADMERRKSFELFSKGITDTIPVDIVVVSSEGLEFNTKRVHKRYNQAPLFDPKPKDTERLDALFDGLTEEQAVEFFNKLYDPSNTTFNYVVDRLDYVYGLDKIKGFGIFAKNKIDEVQKYIINGSKITDETKKLVASLLKKVKLKHEDVKNYVNNSNNYFDALLASNSYLNNESYDLIADKYLKNPLNNAFTRDQLDYVPSPKEQELFGVTDVFRILEKLIYNNRNYEPKALSLLSSSAVLEKYGTVIASRIVKDIVKYTRNEKIQERLLNDPVLEKLVPRKIEFIENKNLSTEALASVFTDVSKYLDKEYIRENGFDSVFTGAVLEKAAQQSNIFTSIQEKILSALDDLFDASGEFFDGEGKSDRIALGILESLLSNKNVSIDVARRVKKVMSGAFNQLLKKEYSSLRIKLGSTNDPETIRFYFESIYQPQTSEYTSGYSFYTLEEEKLIERIAANRNVPSDILETIKNNFTSEKIQKEVSETEASYTYNKNKEKQQRMLAERETRATRPATGLSDLFNTLAQTHTAIPGIPDSEVLGFSASGEIVTVHPVNPEMPSEAEWMAFTGAQPSGDGYVVTDTTGVERRYTMPETSRSLPDYESMYSPRNEQEKKVFDKVSSFVGAKKRNPYLAVAALRLGEGEITAADYADVVDVLNPFTSKNAESIPTKEKLQKYMRKEASLLAKIFDIKDTKTKDPKKGYVKDGELVEARIDIPTFNVSSEAGDTVYAITLHEPVSDTATSVGGTLSYRGATKIISPRMIVRFISAKDVGSIDIAKGAGKVPLATVKGYHESITELPDNLNDPNEWTQVTYNPLRSSFFVDVNSKKAVVSGDEAIMVGSRVFVKNAVLQDRPTGIVGAPGKSTRDIRYTQPRSRGRVRSPLYRMFGPKGKQTERAREQRLRDLTGVLSGISYYAGDTGKWGDLATIYRRMLAETESAVEFAQKWADEMMALREGLPQNVVDDVNLLLGNQDNVYDQKMETDARDAYRKGRRKAALKYNARMKAAAYMPVAQKQLMQASASTDFASEIALLDGALSNDLIAAAHAGHAKFTLDQAAARARLQAGNYDSIIRSADRMRSRLNELGSVIAQVNGTDPHLVATFDSRKGIHLSRYYQIHDDASYADWLDSPDPEARRLRTAAFNYVRGERFNSMVQGYKLVNKGATTLQAVAYANAYFAQQGNEPILRELNDFITKQMRGGGSATRGLVNAALLIEKSNIPAPLRDLLGQYNDNTVVAARTAMEMAVYHANYKFLHGIQEHLNKLEEDRKVRVTFLASKTNRTPDEDEEYRDLDNIMFLTANSDEAKKHGLTLFEPSQTRISHKAFGPLQQFYGPKHIVEAIQELQPELSNTLVNSYAFLLNFALKGATSLNFRGQARNFFSNIALIPGSGFIPLLDRLMDVGNRLAGKELQHRHSARVADLVKSGLPEADAKRQASLEFAEFYAKAGITGGSDLDSLMRDINKIAGVGLDEAFIEMQKGVLSKNASRFASGTLEVLKATDRAAGEIYRRTDDLFKMEIFENLYRGYAKAFGLKFKGGQLVMTNTNKEADKIIKAYENEKLLTTDEDRDLGSDVLARAELLLLRYAARATRVSIPYYDQLPQIINNIKRQKLTMIGAPFVSWPAAILQNTFRTPGLIWKDFQTKETRGMGSRRLAGFLTAMFGWGFLVQNILKGLILLMGKALGDDEDNWFTDFEPREVAFFKSEMEQALQDLLPDYYKYRDVSLLGMKGDKPVWADLSWMNPYSTVRDMFMPFFHPRAGETSFGKNDAWAAFSAKLGQLVLNPQLPISAAYEELTRPDFDVQTASWPEKVLLVMKGVGSTVIPGTVKDFYKIYEARGTEKMWPEAASMVFGLKINVLDVEDQFRRAIRKTDSLDDELGMKLRKIYRDGDANQIQDLPEEYEKAMRNRNELYTDLRNIYESSSVFIGSRATKILTSDEGRRLGQDNIRALRSGFVNPIEVSEFARDAARAKDLREKTNRVRLLDSIIRQHGRKLIGYPE